MSHTIPLKDAENRLAAIIAELPPGDEIMLTENNRPVARLIPASRHKGAPRRGFGSCKGMLTINREDDEHLADFKEYMQ